jgi:hypothetical protein
MTADKFCYGKATVAARGAAVNYNQIDPAHKKTLSLTLPRQGEGTASQGHGQFGFTFLV